MFQGKFSIKFSTLESIILICFSICSYQLIVVGRRRLLILYYNPAFITQDSMDLLTVVSEDFYGLHQSILPPPLIHEVNTED